MGGDFHFAGGVSVFEIAKWDGTTWSALSGPNTIGTNNRVNALAVYDDGGGPALFAGGFFTHAGGIWVNRIAKWDSTAWSTLGDPPNMGTDRWIQALAVSEDEGSPALYAGGEFALAGGMAIERIARWNGSTWSRLAGEGPNATVRALAAHDDGGGEALYVGGNFSLVGGIPSYQIARFKYCSGVFSDGFESGNTSAWSGIGGE